MTVHILRDTSPLMSITELEIIASKTKEDFDYDTHHLLSERWCTEKSVGKK